MKQDPVNSAESIDAPISSTEDLTIMDLLVDKRMGKAATGLSKIVRSGTAWACFSFDCLDHIQDETGAEAYQVHVYTPL